MFQVVSDFGEEYDDFEEGEAAVDPGMNHRHSSNTAKQQHKHSHPPHHGGSKRGGGGPPPISAPSIFTQEEFSSHKQSLHEFEKLEAALDESGSEHGEDNMDLIGAYLRGKINRLNLLTSCIVMGT